MDEVVDVDCCAVVVEVEVVLEVEPGTTTVAGNQN